MLHTHLLYSMENLGIYHLLCFLLLYVILVLMKFLHKVWWRPMHIKHVFLSQGIKGPPYKFFHGNTKEISRMIRENTMTRTTHEYISHDLFPLVQPHIYSWIKLYGKKFLYWDGFGAELVVTEPELIKEMLNERGRYFFMSEFDQYLKKIVGDGILQAEGEKWAKLRKLSNQAFHSESLRNMIPAMVESVEMMLRRWKNENVKEVDVSEEFRVLTAEAISRAAFGSSYLEGGEIFPMLRKLVILSGKNAYKIRLPIISNFLKEEDIIESEKLEKRIRDCMLEIVKKRERLLKTGEINTYGEDFLGLLLKAHYDSNENVKLSIEEVLDECKTFYSAGHGSTSVFLSWTIFLLAIHTDWQERAREEVHNLFGQQPPNPDGIPRLKTISMIINESLRLYPPALFARRVTKKGAKLGNLILPSSIGVSFPTFAVHHDPNIWGEDALVFNPERFSKGIASATKNNPVAFLPFSLGPRVCVGANFAINEAKIAISMILQHYAFTLSQNYIHSPVQILLLRPQHGLQVLLHAL